MSAYLKTLRLHVYLTTTKKSYLGNDKHIEANALVALRHTLSKDQFSIVSHCNSGCVVWNTLTVLELETTNYVEKESLVDESE